MSVQELKNCARVQGEESAISDADFSRAKLPQDEDWVQDFRDKDPILSITVLYWALQSGNHFPETDNALD